MSDQICSSPPAIDEVSSCDDYSEIVAIGGMQKDSKIFIRLAFRTSDTEIVWLRETAARHLGAVLKALSPGFATIDDLEMSADPETGSVSTHSP